MEIYNNQTLARVCAAPVVAFATSAKLRGTGVSLGSGSAALLPISTDGDVSGRSAWSHMA